MAAGADRFGGVCAGDRREVNDLPELAARVTILPWCGTLAQRLEQRTHNPLVAGSNPASPTNKINSLRGTQRQQTQSQLNDVATM